MPSKLRQLIEKNKAMPPMIVCPQVPHPSGQTSGPNEMSWDDDLVEIARMTEAWTAWAPRCCVAAVLAHELASGWSGLDAVPAERDEHEYCDLAHTGVGAA